jgi:hypothetical protein
MTAARDIYNSARLADVYALKPVFRDESRDVIFEAYVAYIRRRRES